LPVEEAVEVWLAVEAELVATVPLFLVNLQVAEQAQKRLSS
jgi:hypothetical protein